jgi:hypothetical protein
MSVHFWYATITPLGFTEIQLVLSIGARHVYQIPRMTTIYRSLAVSIQNWEILQHVLRMANGLYNAGPALDPYDAISSC